MAKTQVNYTPLFSAYDSIEDKRRQQTADQRVNRNALQQFMFKSEEGKTGNGFTRIQRCREALESIDRQGFLRSFHQRLFHDHFIRACARIFWKTEPPGTFARHHQKILRVKRLGPSITRDIGIYTQEVWQDICSVNVCCSHAILDTIT
jgi:hypothetical protein